MLPEERTPDDTRTSDTPAAASLSESPGDAVSLQQQIVEGVAAEAWDEVEAAIARLLALLRSPSQAIAVPRSFLAELYARWGLALWHLDRAEESYSQLLVAEQLFNLDAESADEWATGEGYMLQTGGPPLDPALALETLKALGDTMLRTGKPRTGEILQEIVSVSDLLGDPEEQWESRSRLAAFTAGLADWHALLGLAREMGHLAREWGDLLKLLEAMQYFRQAYGGLQRTYRALEAQKLVVDIAAYLDHPSLSDARAELEKMQQEE